MAIHKSRYEVGEDVFHFETQAHATKVYDRTGKELGTVADLLLEGKNVDGGEFKALKTTGIYSVKGVKGFPEGIPNDKRAILAIRSIGDTSKPDLIFYQVIGANGMIFENTIAGGKESGWVSGGVAIDNSITGINVNIGAMEALTTNQKGSLVEAINSVNDLVGANSSLITSLNNKFTKFEKHNHDDRYVKKTGGAIEGDLTLGNGNGLKLKNKDNVAVNFVNIDEENKVTVGDTSTPINISSKDGLKVNGHKVFTSENNGAGSGIDADKLDGLDSDQFARLGELNTFKKDLTIAHGAKLKIAQGGIDFTRNDGKVTSQIVGRTDGGLEIFNNDIKNIVVDSKGNTTLGSNLYLNAKLGEKRLLFKLNDKDQGIGLYRNSNSKYLGVFNYEDDKFIAQFGTGAGKDGVSFRQAIEVQGRKLFLQGSTPTGNIPAGSIWIS